MDEAPPHLPRVCGPDGAGRFLACEQRNGHQAESTHQLPSQATDVAHCFLSSAQGTLVYKHLLFKFPAFNPVCPPSPHSYPLPQLSLLGLAPAFSTTLSEASWDLAPWLTPGASNKWSHKLEGVRVSFLLTVSHEAVGELWELDTPGSCP